MKLLNNLHNISSVSAHDSDLERKEDGVISDSQKNTIIYINYIFLCEFVSLLGCITNIINLIIFHRQGLNTTINISFYALAISDLCSLVMQQVSNIFVNPLFVALNLPMVYGEVQWVSARTARVIFTRITFFITVYITSERCLCIAFPLHIKQMITPRKTVVILICIYVVTLTAFLPLYGSHYIGWKFRTERNMSLLSLVYREYKHTCTTATYFFIAISGIIAFPSVVALTIILVLKLREKNDWREMAAAHPQKPDSTSKRDKATVKMVVLISSILIVCYTPSVLLSSVTFIEPEFREDGKYHNVYSSLWSVAMVMENINSSVNIFFYFKMSSKYRQTFRELFPASLSNKNFRT